REKLTRTTGRLAAGVRLELIQPAIGIHARCPRLKRDCLGVLTRRGKTPLARQPHTFLRRRRTAEQDPAVGRTRCGTWRRSTLASGSALAPWTTLRRGGTVASLRHADLDTAAGSTLPPLLLSTPRRKTCRGENQHHGRAHQEAMSHVTVSRAIDQRGRPGWTPRPASLPGARLSPPTSRDSRSSSWYRSWPRSRQR